MSLPCPSNSGIFQLRPVLKPTTFNLGMSSASELKRRASCAGLIAAVATLVAPSTLAAVWTVAPSIDLSTSYTDNVTLAAKGQEQEDTVLTIAPGVSVTAVGHELNVLLDYGFEQLLYANDSGRNHSRQFFSGRADAILVPDLVFLSGSGKISQQLVDLNGNAGLSDLAVSESAGEVKSWTLSPFLRRRMGNLQLALGINFDLLDYPGTSGDSFGREYRFEVGSNPQRQYMSEWQVGLSRREVFFEGNSDDQLYETLNALYRYHLSPYWMLEASAGYVRNNFQYDPAISQSPEGGTWTAGFVWTPSARTSVTAGAGENYFGATHFASIEHRDRFNTFQYEYSEDITSTRQSQLNKTRTPTRTDESGAPIPEPNTKPGDPSELDLLIVSQTTEVFIGKRSKLAWMFRGTHLSLGADAYRERRELQSSGGTETVAGSGANAGWHPSGRSDFQVSYNKQKADFISGRADTYRDTKLEFNRRFQPKVTGSLDYLRNQRQTLSSTITEYVNHVVTARLNIKF